MESITCVSLLGFLVLLGFTGMVVGAGGSSPACGFPAIYNFGDSNSDTGAISAAFSEIPLPNGETFFGHPSGRYCDGRLIIDFIAEELKLPYLSPYLDSIGTSFRQGANFATGGSSILKGGYSPFDLGVQISQFRRFKSHTTALYNKLIHNRKSPPFKTNLPVPGDFSKALYTFDIGQNDLSHGFQYSTVQQTRASIPSILATFSWAVQQLYKEGARFFWVHNTGPVGCLPYSVIYSGKSTGNLDQSNCVRPLNEVAQEFNRQLKNVVLKLRTQLPLAAITYADVYSVKYSLISNAKNQGFVDPLNFCCGSYYGYHINCGQRAVVNGTVYGEPCAHPSNHISWDGIHYSQAANLWVAGRVLNGSFSDPPVSIQEACRYRK